MTKPSNDNQQAGIDAVELLRKIQRKGPAPVQLWDPPYCGEMDMLIAKDGSWIHEGQPIRRRAMVELFASVLKLEDDGKYYLVTPVEKVGIRVEDCPFVAVEMDVIGQGEEQKLCFTTNIGDKAVAGGSHRLRVDVDPLSSEPHPIIHIRNGLEALINRAVFYRLMDLVVQDKSLSGEFQMGIWSDGIFFQIQSKA